MQVIRIIQLTYWPCGPAASTKGYDISLYLQRENIKGNLQSGSVLTGWGMAVAIVWAIKKNRTLVTTWTLNCILKLDDRLDTWTGGLVTAFIRFLFPAS